MNTGRDILLYTLCYAFQLFVASPLSPDIPVLIFLFVDRNIFFTFNFNHRRGEEIISDKFKTFFFFPPKFSKVERKILAADWSVRLLQGIVTRFHASLFNVYWTDPRN